MHNSMLCFTKVNNMIINMLLLLDKFILITCDVDESYDTDVVALLHQNRHLTQHLNLCRYQYHSQFLKKAQIRKILLVSTFNSLIFNL